MASTSKSTIESETSSICEPNSIHQQSIDLLVNKKKIQNPVIFTKHTNNDLSLFKRFILYFTTYTEKDIIKYANETFGTKYQSMSGKRLRDMFENQQLNHLLVNPKDCSLKDWNFTDYTAMMDVLSEDDYKEKFTKLDLNEINICGMCFKTQFKRFMKRNLEGFKDAPLDTQCEKQDTDNDVDIDEKMIVEETKCDKKIESIVLPKDRFDDCDVNDEECNKKKIEKNDAVDDEAVIKKKRSYKPRKKVEADGDGKIEKKAVKRVAKKNFKDNNDCSKVKKNKCEKIESNVKNVHTFHSEKTIDLTSDNEDAVGSNSDNDV